MPNHTATCPFKHYMLQKTFSSCSVSNSHPPLFCIQDFILASRKDSLPNSPSFPPEVVIEPLSLLQMPKHSPKQEYVLLYSSSKVLEYTVLQISAGLESRGKQDDSEKDQQLTFKISPRAAMQSSDRGQLTTLPMLHCTSTTGTKNNQLNARPSQP